MTTNGPNSWKKREFYLFGSISILAIRHGKQVLPIKDILAKLRQHIFILRILTGPILENVKLIAPSSILATANFAEPRLSVNRKDHVSTEARHSQDRNMSSAYVLIFDDYADWELGHVLAELRRYGKVEVITVGFSDQAVTSMGGLSVIPDKSIGEIDIQDVLIFIIPGGNLWEGPYPKDEIEQILHRLEEAQKPIAAICAATTAIARSGLLKSRKHTSNSLSYLLKMVPEYSESENFVNSLAIRDQHIITASGLGSIEFTMEIFNELDLATQEKLAIWYDAFKHGIYPENAEPGT